MLPLLFVVYLSLESLASSLEKTRSIRLAWQPLEESYESIQHDRTEALSPDTVVDPSVFDESETPVSKRTKTVLIESEPPIAHPLPEPEIPLDSIFNFDQPWITTNQRLPQLGESADLFMYNDGDLDEAAALWQALEDAVFDTPSSINPPTPTVEAPAPPTPVAEPATAEPIPAIEPIPLKRRVERPPTPVTEPVTEPATEGATGIAKRGSRLVVPIIISGSDPSITNRKEASRTVTRELLKLHYEMETRRDAFLVRQFPRATWDTMGIDTSKVKQFFRWMEAERNAIDVKSVEEVNYFKYMDEWTRLRLIFAAKPKEESLESLNEALKSTITATQALADSYAKEQ